MYWKKYANSKTITGIELLEKLHKDGFIKYIMVLATKKI